MAANGYLDICKKVGEKAAGKVSETFNRISGKNVETRMDEFTTLYGGLLANMDENIDAITETCLETQRQVRSIAGLQDVLRSAMDEVKRNSWRQTLSLALSGAALIGMIVLGVYILIATGR